MSEHPSDWKMANIGEITEIKASNIDKKIASDQKLIPVCNYTDVVTNSRITRGVNFLLSSATPAQIKTFSLTRNDLLITKDAEVGRVSIVEDQIRDLVCGYHLYQLRTSSNEVLPEYLFYALQSFEVQSYFKKERTGTTIAGLARSSLDEARIPLPSLPEQKKIAEILSQIDHAIKLNKKNVEKYKLLIKAFREKTQDCKGEINRIGDLIKKITTGVSVNGENKTCTANQYGVLKVNCISGGEFFPKENKTILDADIKRATIPVKKGMLLMSRANTLELVGACGITKSNHPNLFLPDKIWNLEIKIDLQVSKEWLNNALNSENIKQQIKDVATGTSSTMRNISQSDFLNIKIKVPSIDTQINQCKIIALIFERKTLIEKKLNYLLSLKEGIMNDLLSGRKRVNIS